MTRRRLGDILRSRGVLGERELRFALDSQRARGMDVRLGRLLVEGHLVSDRAVSLALADQVGWVVHEGAYEADEESLAFLGVDFFRERGIFPQRSGQPKIFIVRDGDDTASTDLLEARVPGGAVFRVGEEQDIARALALLGPGLVAAESESTSGDAGLLLQEAVAQGASDIHLEFETQAAHVRFRVDGVLHHHRSLARAAGLRCINMFYTRAGLNAGDHLRFHDARFMAQVAGREWDVRLSHVPALHGPSLVLRLLERGRAAMSLEALGYAPVHLERIQRALRHPHGIFLFTGPTGCGKTTSLYALVNAVRSMGLKVVTVEDPVEVALPMACQIQVDARRDRDFHHAVRALLRHDPDIMLIGEIRDEKTAREAMRAALTGHRVFATLHTNDALGALLRLSDLGIDPGQMAGTLRMVSSQRLVRRLCPHCRAPGPQGFVSHGCPRCLDGYRGRTVVAETFLLETPAVAALAAGAMGRAVDLCRESPGSMGLRDDAVRLVREGMTSMDEVMRVLG